MANALDLGEMTALLIQLAEMNSFSHNLPGLADVAQRLRQELATLEPDRLELIDNLSPARSIGENGETVEQPVGPLLLASKRPSAPTRVLLMIHYDTVYPPDNPFPINMLDSDHLRGPGVADAKGGIVVLLNALRAFEESRESEALGWTVLLNPDEEIGSPGSADHIRAAAQAHHLGLVYEPPPGPDVLVTRRKGSGNFSVVFHGRAAHAGREIEKGRNAVVAAARLAVGLQGIPAVVEEATVNVAKIDGGGPANVVPDLAILRFNCRANTPEQQRELEQRLAELVARCNVDGITAELHGQFSSPPWVMSPANESLQQSLLQTAQEIGLTLRPTTSGGASDANKLASHGLDVLDSLGPVGYSIHSENETVHLPSLVDRARLSALLLAKLASGQIALRG
jgi:glutamate carboxypeptidase